MFLATIFSIPSVDASTYILFWQIFSFCSCRPQIDAIPGKISDAAQDAVERQKQKACPLGVLDRCEGSLGLTWHDGIKTACEDEDDQTDIYSLYIYSPGKKSLHLEKPPAHWTLHSQLVWQYRVPSEKNLPTKQAFCRVESWDWFWRKGACQYVSVTFLWDCPRNFNGEFQPSGKCGGCFFFFVFLLVWYPDVFFSMVFGCTSCFLVLRGISTSGGFQCIFLFSVDIGILNCGDKNKQPQPPHIYAKKTLADRCHSEQVGRCGTRCRWATKAEGRWEGSHYLAKDVEIRTVTLPHEIDTKNDGVWNMNLCWLQNRVSTVSMLNFLGGVDLLENEHRLFVATYVSLPEMFEILWRQDECGDTLHWLFRVSSW